MVDPYVEALLREREGYKLSPHKQHRLIAVDQELGRYGVGVNDKGELVQLDELKATRRPPKERAVERAPERAVDDA